MKITLCDDDPKVLQELTKYIREFYKLSSIPLPELSLFSSGDQLLEESFYGDIIFLDIEMPGQSGICTGRKIMQKNPYAKVIVLTTYPEYLDEAMECRVFRYLTKPIDKNRLFRNLKLAIKQYMEETTTIDIITKDSLITCNTRDIICVKYNNRKTYIYTTTGIIESSTGIGYWEKTLTNPCFFQTHRSYIINMGFIMKIEKINVTLIHNEQMITAYLTARKYSELISSYLQYRGGCI